MSLEKAFDTEKGRAEHRREMWQEKDKEGCFGYSFKIYLLKKH